MADEIRVTRDEAVGVRAREDDVAFRPDSSLQADLIDDPEEAQTEIEMTRARMSGTIDEIEDVLLRRKERIQDRLDVFGPVRERPLPAAGIALGAGLVLGLLTGGNEDDDRVDGGFDRGAAGSGLYWRERAETWERRARRLLDFARDQEERLLDLEEDWGEVRARSLDRDVRDRWDENGFDDEDEPGAFRSAVDTLRDTITGGLAGFLSHAVREMTGGGAGRRTG